MFGLHIYCLPGGRWDVPKHAKRDRREIICRLIGHKGPWQRADDPWRDCTRCGRREMYLSGWHMTLG